MAGRNDAVTLRAEVTETVHLFPETDVHPDQPPKMELPSALGVTVSVAELPLAKFAVQLDPVAQLKSPPMPPVEVTVPDPGPFTLTVTG